jgi:hypothetical protein
MATFEIKQVNVPLFGMVDGPNQATWLSIFSAPQHPSTTTICLDASALDIIAEDLELDAEGLVADAER